MRINLLFIFLILFSYSVLAIDYKPGEKIDLPYSNYTNVSGPCHITNDSLYVNANIPTGVNICQFYYQAFVQQSNPTGGGGGGSSTYRKLTLSSPQPVQLKINVNQPIKYVDKVIDKIVEKVVEKPVDKIIEKEIPCNITSATNDTNNTLYIEKPKSQINYFNIFIGTLLFVIILLIIIIPILLIKGVF